MNALSAIARRWCRDVLDGWNRFWFAPSDVATLGLIRICAGAMLFYTHLVWSLDLQAFFGADSWIRPSAIAHFEGREGAWSYFYLIDSPALLWTVHIAALVVFALLTVGFFSRTMSVLAFLATVSYANRVPGALFGLDDTNAMLALYLMVGPCGAAFSVDRWLKRRRQPELPKVAEPSVGANIAIRLIQIHLCIIYLFSGLGKLQGRHWWDGTAVWYAVSNLEYQSFDLTWMSKWPRVVDFLTQATVFWETFYCALVWPLVTRPLVLAMAVAVHLGIGLFMGMMTFGLVMLIANLAFVPPRAVRAALGLFSRREGRAGQGRQEKPVAGERVLVERSRR